MPDPTDEFKLHLQLCEAGMDLGDVTRLGAELIPECIPHTVTVPWPVGTPPGLAPPHAPGTSAHPTTPPTETAKSSRPAPKRNVPATAIGLPPCEPNDPCDQDVDLAHADHPTDTAGAAVHTCKAGNETPLRIQVCRPSWVKTPQSCPLPAPTKSSVSECRRSDTSHRCCKNIGLSLRPRF